MENWQSYYPQRVGLFLEAQGKHGELKITQGFIQLLGHMMVN